jgi:hypothetical protein
MKLRTRAVIVLPILLAAAAASCIRTPDATADFDKAVDKLVAAGFPQALETYFCSLGTNPDLGFRWAGTTAERAVGERVAAEMRAMGLANVRLEPVPVDVFEFEKASLTIGGRTMTASTIAGVPPTSASGVTAPVVYVKGGTAADFDAAGGVAGKIVLVDMKMGSWWFSPPAFEAGHRRAAGVICTFTPDDPKYFSANDQALGSFDGQYDLGAPPWFYISRRDGDWLKSALKTGPVTATLLLREKVTLARDGGTAYNVVGELPGAGRDGQMVLFAAHQDAHFRAGADDTGALVNLLTIARAMCESRYRPARTVVFLATAGEEFGYTNAYYEWLTGAWWAATHAHRDWAGRVRVMINLETMAIKGAPLALRSNPELRPWTEGLASRHKDLLPYGAEPLIPVNSWNDQWTFTAAGVPSVKFETSGEDYDKLYHSNFETAALVDWDYLGKVAKFAFRAAKELDSGLLPYSLKARADDLAAAAKKDDLISAGADPAAVSRLEAAVGAFGRAAAAFDSRPGTFPAGRIDTVNAGLLEIEKAVNSGLTALSPPDDDATIYPHELVLRDLRGINAALAALKTPRPDRAAALKALAGVYFTRLGLIFSYPVYQKHLERLDPGYGLITWGGQGQLPKPVDVVPQYRMIEAGKTAVAAAELEAKRRALVDDLNARLLRMSGVLEQATTRIEALRHP